MICNPTPPQHLSLSSRGFVCVVHCYILSLWNMTWHMVFVEVMNESNYL